MHCLILAEGYVDDLKRFEDEHHNKMYGKAKLRMREIKLYTSSINEAGLEEYLSEMKGYESISGDRVKKIAKIMKGMLRFLGVKQPKEAPINAQVIKPKAEGGNPYNAHFVVLGVVDDLRNDKGVEQV
jgi:hypothetical protein